MNHDSMNQKKTKPAGRKPKARPPNLSPQERRQILDLRQNRYGTREIARRVGRDRKTVRRVLDEEGLLNLPCRQRDTSKLDPFRELIQGKVKDRLTVTRILREIRAAGYSGGRTILGQYIRTIQAPLTPRRRVKRRFETRPGLEMQADWAVYTVPIAGLSVRVHALMCELACSRKIHAHFYRNERQATLLEGLTRAFTAFEGVATRIVFDNMATVVLGRIGANGRPIWHPRFLEFARYYGFEPFACRVRDPDRKGKTERVLDFLEKDVVRGSSFSSFDDLNERVTSWVDTVANRRIHGTTRTVPDEAWLSERDFLIRLPDVRFAVYKDEVRQVDDDATISIAGTLYTVPERLANHSVAVHLYAEHFEVLDRSGLVAFSRRYVEPNEKGRLQIDPAHYVTLPRRAPDGPATRIDDAFLKRFPSLAGLVEGLARRMKSLAPIHLRALWRLADLYGEEAFLRAANRALEYRRFNAEAVRRILEREHPLPENPPPILPLSASARAHALLDEVDPGSLDGYHNLDIADSAVAASSPKTPDQPSAPDTNTDTEDDSNGA